MTVKEFDYFVVLAGMRTGSNLLEENLAAFPGIESYGELFNPHFFGKPNVETMFGLSMAARESDPVRTIGAMRSEADGLPGFRLFYDHNPRAIAHVLGDRKAAKIVLTRRPIDSYVSLKIARKTGQWWLGDLTRARKARVPFDPDEYVDFLNTLADFQYRIERALQTSGQSAFHIGYDDLSDQNVINGLGRFLGIEAAPDMSKVRAKVQNPSPLAERLTNPTVAEDALRSIAVPDIGQMQMHEPGRGPGLKFFRVCKSAPLLYMPIRGAGFDPVPNWMKSVDPEGEISGGMGQRDLRRWKRQHPGHRSFTVVRHPLPRAYDAFCRCVLSTGEEPYADLRAAMISQYDLPLPAEWPDAGWSLENQRAAFLAFLKFLKGNLGGQTSLRVDNTWATQDILLNAIGQFSVPDRVIREDALVDGLLEVAGEAGLSADAPDASFEVTAPYALAEVRTESIDVAVEDAYRRDYMMFGFSRWLRAETDDQAA
ncbi:MAG: sulfotransferase domain-containing protein [Boseongicola sp.]